MNLHIVVETRMNLLASNHGDRPAIGLRWAGFLFLLFSLSLRSGDTC